MRPLSTNTNEGSKKLGGHSKDEMLELVEERAVRWAEGTK